MAFLTLPLLLSLGFAASAVVAVIAHARNHRTLIYVFKPLSTGLLLILVAAGPSGFSSVYAVAILAGLFFSLLGDVFLMLPSDHFRSGLVSFLIAHACYLFAFLSDNPLAAPVMPFVIGAVIGGFIVRALWAGIPSRLRLPVVIYIVLLLVMASQAASRAMHLQTAPAVYASFGAVLFVLSDFILAWDRFRKHFPAAQALIHAAYFLAQGLIAISSYAAWPMA